MDTATLVDRLDAELATADYAEVDASANGLQVGTRAGQIEHVAFAVDAVTETIEGAVARDADLLVVHHGLSWGGIERVTGRTYDRVAPLVRNDLDLYVSHLPLDGHQSLGNAAGIGDLLDLDDRQPFGELGPVHIGQQGRFPAPTSATEIRERLDESLDHAAERVRVLDFGPDAIEDVAIVTGAGTDWFDEAVAADVDAFLTGEPKAKLYHMARESGVTVFLGGHYATETFGVRALADTVGDWGPETSVIDAPTGL